MSKKKIHSSRYRAARRRKSGGQAVLLLALVLLCSAALIGVWLLVSRLTGKKTPPGVDSTPSSSQSSSAAISSAPSSSSTVESTPTVSSEPVVSSEPTDDVVKDEYYEEKAPVVANRFQKIPEDYTVDLVSVGNYQLEERTAKAYKDMADAAANDGISLWIVSAFRSYEDQVTNYNNTKQRHLNNGLSEEDAIIETEKYIAVPGSSEHGLGTTVDLNSLYTTFEDSKEYEWLKANCWKYGFVERYPKDKEDVTHISFEPWHYRYVGSNHSKIIVENNFCLEEYETYLKEK